MLHTQPCPTYPVSLYAPSQLTDPVADEARKDKFRDELLDLHDNFSRPALNIYIYIYVYIYIYTYIHTYIYIYINIYLWAI